MRLLLTVILALMLACIAKAGDLPGTGSHVDSRTGDSHAWTAIPTRTGSVAIQHFPPRGVDAAGRKGAEDGAIRLATTLAQMPEGLAAISNRLYMVFPPSAGGVDGVLRRQVMLVEAERGSVDGTWVGDPGGGRLPSVPALPGHRRLLGFVGTPAGPAALIADSQAAGTSGSESGPVEVFVLLREGWKPMARPKQVSAEQAREMRLVSMPDGLAMVFVKPSEAGIWTTVIGAGATAETLEAAEWEWKPLMISALLAEGTAISGLWYIRGRVIVEQLVGDGVEIWDAGLGGECRRLSQVKGVTKGYASAPLDQTGRLVIAWRPTPASSSSKSAVAAERLRIAEVSIQTGQILHEGEAQSQPPFSTFELKVLAAFLVLVMLAIVIFVLRPEAPTTPLSLPKGVLLAEPGRRVFAAIIDAGLALLIATKVTGVGASEAISVSALTGQVDAVTLYLSTIAVGLGLGTLTEWLLGRSVGKALTGMEVVRPVFVKKEDGGVEAAILRVRLWGALIRNIVKWVLPPVAMSGLSAMDHRHRGDLSGGTVVIVREEPRRP